MHQEQKRRAGSVSDRRESQEDFSGGIFTFDVRRRRWLGDNSTAMSLLKRAIMLHQFARIVTDRCGDALPGIAHGLDDWINSHGDFVAPTTIRSGAYK